MDVTFIRKNLGEREVLWRALNAMFQHGTADNLPGVLPVGQHDALVHDHALRGGAGRLPGDPDDVEVRSFVWIGLGSVCFITFGGGEVY